MWISVLRHVKGKKCRKILYSSSQWLLNYFFMKFHRKKSAEKWKWKINSFGQHFLKLRFRDNRAQKSHKKNRKHYIFEKPVFLGLPKSVNYNKTFTFWGSQKKWPIKTDVFMFLFWFFDFLPIFGVFRPQKQHVFGETCCFWHLQINDASHSV